MELVEAIFATAELCGTRLSEPAARLLAQDLAQYDEALIIPALARCRRELKGRLTVAEVLSRIDDGHPGPKEAWALIPADESTTAVLTPEIADAWMAARPLLDCGDKAAARMAFEERYVQLLNQAREAGSPARWQVSLGWDVALREGPIREAVARNRLTPAQARAALPGMEFAGDKPALPAGESVRHSRHGLRRQIESALPGVTSLPPARADYQWHDPVDIDKETRRRIHEEVQRKQNPGDSGDRR